MAKIYEGANRGRTRNGWLDSFHSFSFGGYTNPNRMGIRNLRVINEDRVIPGAGFGEHSHAHMDILTYVISGTLRHVDSMGNAGDVTPGQIQLMSAGPGVRHSEMNASTSEPVHFLQIWLIPERQIEAPRYATLEIDPAQVDNRFGLLAGPESRNMGLPLLSDTRIRAARIATGQSVAHALESGMVGYLHVVQGQLGIENETLMAGDALVYERPGDCRMTAITDADVLLFTLC